MGAPKAAAQVAVRTIWKAETGTMGGRDSLPKNHDHCGHDCAGWDRFIPSRCAIKWKAISNGSDVEDPSVAKLPK